MDVAPNPALDAFLQSIPLFSLVEPADRVELLRLLEPVTLAPGEVLFREKDPGTALWVLGEGVEVSISATPPNAKRPVVVAYARGGETVGEMALVDDGGRSGTAVVMEGGPAHRIDATAFQALRDAHHPAAFKVLRQICTDLCARLRATSDRIVSRSAGVPGTETDLGRPISPEVLDEYPPFQKLPQVVKLALAQRFRLVETTAVQPLFGEGDEGDAAYFVLSGEITVGRNGRTLANLGPGSMFGMVAVIDRGGRSASCLTTGPARLLRLSAQEFDSLFATGNRFAFQMVDLVSRQLVAHVRGANALLPMPGHPAPPTPPAAAPMAAVMPEGDEPDLVIDLVELAEEHEPIPFEL